MTEQRGAFTPEQVRTLLNPIKPNRVLSVQGHSHVSQQDITAHLIRMFGFGNFDIEVLNAELIFETQRVDNKSGELLPKWDVCYRAMVRITVRNPDGVHVATYENGSTATAQNQSRGDGHDLAYKSAISLSIKRAAIALGDQFGLSLYNKGQITPLVIATLVGHDKPTGDVQDRIPQQVSLGNDEVDPDAAPEASPQRRVSSTRERVAAALDAIHTCDDPARLDDVEQYVTRLGVAGIGDVRDALTDRRSDLGSSGVDHWVPAGGASPDASPDVVPSAGLTPEEFEAAEAARFDAEAGAA